ncbi:endonuclease/exonuclease/phosphatase family protein [Patescibacteria group bacterium]|nr:endonuclease/exonuclease/phosphatase family protein [Patescibacteria group bacterium]
MQLKLLSWNIWGGKYLPEVIDFLRSADADIIALQEVILEPDGKTNTASTIADALGYNEVHALGMEISSKWIGPVRDPEVQLNFGNAVLSKHKIENSAAIDLSAPEYRQAIWADIIIGSQTLRVFSIHLKHNHVINGSDAIEQLQNEQVNTIIKALPADNAIVMGDFNSLPESEPIKIMSGALKNTEIGTVAPTWSSYPEGCSICQPKNVEYKFDYIFAGKNLKAGGFKVYPSKASDHLPVTAILDI